MLAIYVSGFDGFTLFNNCFLVSAKVLDMSHTLLYCAANLQGDFHGPPCFSLTHATPSTVCSFLTVSGSPIKGQARVDHSVSHKPFWREHHTPVLNHRDQSRYMSITTHTHVFFQTRQVVGSLCRRCSDSRKINREVPSSL